MADNLIRTKQINQADLSGAVQNVIASNQYEITYGGGTGININDVGQITISGTDIYLIDSVFNVSGTGVFNALDLNNIDTLSLSGVDISITSGNVFLTNPLSAPNLVYNTGNQTISGVKTFANSGIFSLSGAAPLGLPNNPLSIVGSGNTYLQLNIQNRATGAFASADLVITANNGTDSTNYINLGINNSGYNDPTFTNGSGLDGYLFIDGGNLDIGTRTAGRAIEFHAGGTTAGSTIARITSSGVNIVTGNLTTNRINSSFNFMRNPLNFYLDGGIKTGRINILTGIAPFSRQVYSGNLGILNNPNETMILFSTTGNVPRPSLERVIASRNIALGGQTVSVALGTHTEQMFNSSTNITNNCAIEFSPYGGAGTIGGSTTVTHVGSFSIIDPTKFSNDLLYVTRDFNQAYNTKSTIANFSQFIVSGSSFINLIGSTTYKTGITYAQNAAQYLTGFLIGFYTNAAGGNLNCNPFNACGAAGVNGTSTGCHIVFESAWLTTDAVNNSWLNMAFRNHGPSGMRFATSQGFPNGANPTGIFLDMFAFDT